MFQGGHVRINVYIDGFNLYYGSVEGTPYKWLDIAKLVQRKMPADRISRIRYFTALVTGRPADPQQPQRQLTYIRALQTIPSLTVHYGQFMSRVVTMRVAKPPPDYCRVIRTDEKGSDVNLATYLVRDAYEGEFEVALVVSNDSDLAEAITIVKSRQLPAGVLFPVNNPGRHPSVTLSNVASFVKRVRRRDLAACQFPASLTDSRGLFSKPVGW